MPWPWYLYIVECDHSCYYTGIAMDVSRRVAEHQSKSRKSARFTRAFSHIELVYSVPACNRSTAAKLEFHLKKKSHREKSLIIQQQFTLEQLWNYLFP